MIFTSAIAYVDVIIIIPTTKYHDIKSSICEVYADKHCNTFNAKKIISLVFKLIDCIEPNVCMQANGDTIRKNKCTEHLGQSFS